MTEAAHQMTSNIPSSRIPGTVGIGIGVEVGIFDDRGTKLSNGEIGEVCVRGENVTKGYWKNDKANKESFWEGGWFRFVTFYLLSLLSDETIAQPFILEPETKG
jgi:long-subunit acyl-CoA synthetase (AMP-forming)